MNSSFPIKDGSFSIRNGSFPIRNAPFSIGNRSFSIKDGSFLIRNEPFHIKSGIVLIKRKSNRVGFFIAWERVGEGRTIGVGFVNNQKEWNLKHTNIALKFANAI